jgi:hypothetical protein
MGWTNVLVLKNIDLNGDAEAFYIEAPDDFLINSRLKRTGTDTALRRTVSVADPKQNILQPIRGFVQEGSGYTARMRGIMSILFKIDSSR